MSFLPVDLRETLVSMFQSFWHRVRANNEEAVTEAVSPNIFLSQRSWWL